MGGGGLFQGRQEEINTWVPQLPPDPISGCVITVFSFPKTLFLWLKLNFIENDFLELDIWERVVIQYVYLSMI